jgi:hypothetical protein
VNRTPQALGTRKPDRLKGKTLTIPVLQALSADRHSETSFELPIEMCPPRGGTGGTRGYSKGNASSEGVPVGGTGWYRQADHTAAIPPGTPLGTTLAVHFPFEYHRYPQYHLGDDGVESGRQYRVILVGLLLLRRLANL